MTQEHQNAAVLFSDIVGYTAMMQQDEQGAIALVNRYRSVLETTVTAYYGKVQQYYGDGSLTTFNSVENALKCAWDLQKQLQTNPILPLRIGIHYGKVVFHDQKIFGDTVNLASRIESMGQSGAVMVSKKVVQQVANNKSFSFSSLGEHKFKNVSQEMELFALTNPPLAVPDPNSLTGKTAIEKPTQSWAVFWGMLVVFLGVLGIFYFSKQPNATAFDEVTKELGQSLAVLPFVNLSPDTAQHYWGAGLAEELITIMTKEPLLRVTSKGSSFSFDGSGKGLPTIAQELGVKYVLEGSVEQVDHQLRIAVNLVHASAEEQVWSQTWQKNVDEIYLLPKQIVDSVKIVIFPDHPQESAHQITTDPRAHNLLLQARYVENLGNVQSTEQAQALVQEALAIDSLYADGWAYQARLANRQANIGLIPAAEGHQLAKQAAQKALALDSAQAQAYCTLTSIAIYYDWDFELAQKYLKQAIRLDPGSLTAIKLASNLAFCQGQVEEAIRLDQLAIAIDPISAKNHFDLGYTYFFAGQGADSEGIIKKGLTLGPNHLGAKFLLSLALLQQGKLSEAQMSAAEEPYDILRMQALALVAVSQGVEDSASHYLQEIKEQYAQVAPYQIAQIYAYQGQIDSAFHWLNLSYQHRDGGLVHLRVDPLLRSLRRDDRWTQLLMKMGYPSPVAFKD